MYTTLHSICKNLKNLLQACGEAVINKDKVEKILGGKERVLEIKDSKNMIDNLKP